jgi:NADPH:quinone reductase-like Zn-dependent oxidoreductase
VLHELGGPDVLRLEDVEVPDPNAGELRIRVAAFGLNRSEAMFREGWHPLKPVLPSRIGYEAAGIVESVGSGVGEFAPGDAVSTLPVMDINARGGYGELMTVSADLVARNPPELDMVHSAALWSSYITAYAGLVELAGVKPGDTVLVTAASSSVGPPAIQILKMLGARVIAVTRRRTKAVRVGALGADDVIVTDDEDLLARVATLTDGKGVDLVFDPVAGPAIATLAEATAPYGSIVVYGVLDFAAASLPVQPLIEKNLSIRGYAMYLADRPDRNARAIAFIREGVAKGLLRPLVDRRFALDEIVEAARYFDSMDQIGKVVVETGPPIVEQVAAAR